MLWDEHSHGKFVRSLCFQVSRYLPLFHLFLLLSFLRQAAQPSAEPWTVCFSYTHCYLRDHHLCLCVCVFFGRLAKTAWLTLSCETEWMGRKQELSSRMIGVWGLRILSVSHTQSPGSIEHQEINLLFPLSVRKEEQKEEILLQQGDSFYLLTTPSSSPSLLLFLPCICICLSFSQRCSCPLWLLLKGRKKGQREKKGREPWRWTKRPLKKKVLCVCVFNPLLYYLPFFSFTLSPSSSSSCFSDPLRFLTQMVWLYCEASFKSHFIWKFVLWYSNTIK